MKKQANLKVATWARNLPSHFYFDRGRGILDEEVPLWSFPENGTIVHIEVLLQEKPISFRWPYPIPYIEWATLQYQFGIAKSGYSLILLTHQPSRPGKILHLDVRAKTKWSRIELRPMDEQERLVAYSNYFEPWILQALGESRAPGRYSFKKWYRHRHEDLIRRAAAMPPGHGIFHKLSRSAADGVYRRFYPRAEAELQRYDLSGRLLGLVEADFDTEGPPEGGSETVESL